MKAVMFIFLSMLLAFTSCDKVDPIELPTIEDYESGGEYDL